MATIYNLAITRNPNFNTVLGLTNTVFDRNNVRSGQMATEDQIQQLWQDIIQLEERIDYCCRDIVFWDFRVRIRDKFGNIISGYLENRTTGIVRRGKNYVMKLPIKAIPKYEAELPNRASYPENFQNNDVKSCIKNELSYTYINDLCSILYRGNSGDYYEMSARKDQGGLGFVSPGVGTSGSGSISVYMIDENGNEGQVNLIRTGGSTGTSRYLSEYSHFAYENGGDIYINVYAPISNSESFSGSTKKKPYGRIYYLDVRDVTLGG